VAFQGARLNRARRSKRVRFASSLCRSWIVKSGSYE
jgi:hypothetical protein